MKKIINDNDGFILPLIMFIMVLVIAGLFYTVFILWIGIPFFDAFIPNGDAKTFMLMLIFGMPLFILIGCSIWFIRVSLKKGLEGGTL